jgi:DNA polymerase-3 subunit delta
VAELKPCYLIWGDDEVMLDAWRARVRARAEEEALSASLEVLRGERLSGDEVASSMATLTLSAGRRYLLADGVERWREADVKAVAAALESIPPETVLVLVAAGKAPAALVKAVERAGGDVHECEAPNAARYPGWVVERARRIGIEIDRDAAKALVTRVGYDEDRKARLQRVVRELEKLQLFVGAGARIDVDAVEQLTASDVDTRVFDLADAIIEQDPERALRFAEELRSLDVDMMHILFALLRQLRNCRQASAMLAGGKSAKDLQAELRVPPWVAKRIVAQARNAELEQLERALWLLAELDYEIRGGGNLDADSALTLTVARAAGALEPEPA